MLPPVGIEKLTVLRSLAFATLPLQRACRRGGRVDRRRGRTRRITQAIAGGRVGGLLRSPTDARSEKLTPGIASVPGSMVENAPPRPVDFVPAPAMMQ
jgi:hypothetical protein